MRLRISLRSAAAVPVRAIATRWTRIERARALRQALRFAAGLLWVAAACSWGGCAGKPSPTEGGSPAEAAESDGGGSGDGGAAGVCGAGSGSVQWTRLIAGIDSTTTLRLDGPEWNNTLVKDAVIHDVTGDGIYINDVSNVCIEGVTVRNVSGSGIRLGISGSTTDVTIVGSQVSDTGHNGINAGQRHSLGVDHTNLQILRNTVSTTGKTGTQGLHHGLYIQASDFLIDGNNVTASLDGNGISVRSSGIVRNNTVDGAAKSGISYYSDHMRGPTNTLVIESNTVRNAGLNSTRVAINVLNIFDPALTVQSFIINNNDIGSSRVDVHEDYKNPDIYQVVLNGQPYW